jgi:hypothetical protein
MGAGDSSLTDARRSLPRAPGRFAGEAVCAMIPLPGVGAGPGE